MADSDGSERKTSMADAVSQITVKALQQYRAKSSGLVQSDRNDEERISHEDESIAPQRADEETPPTRRVHYTEAEGSPDAYDDEIDHLTGENDYDDDVDDDVDDEEDDDAEAMVLDPDHPLMKRVQAALTVQLTKQNERLEVELRAKIIGFKERQTRREELGVDLYRLQQQLAHQQASLEEEQDKFSSLKEHRSLCEKQLDEARNAYQMALKNAKEEREKTDSLRADVELLSNRLNYVKSAQNEMETEIALKKRHAEKAGVELAKVEKEKQQQDFYVDRLNEEARRLEEQIAMYEMQAKAQQEEYKNTKEALGEANTEVDALTMEQKQLLQQWNNSLLAMRRRDEALATMNAAVGIQRDRIQSLKTEMDGYRRSIQKEQEKNETLTVQLKKLENDLALLKRHVAACETKREMLRMEYSKYTRMLQGSEQELSKATTECAIKQNELVALRKQTERVVLEKNRLEDAILEKTMAQLTLEKASQYTKNEANRIRKAIKDEEAKLAQVENEISRQVLEISNRSTRLERSKEIIVDHNKEVKQLNDLITRSENEMIRRNAVIERKQSMIDQLNKKIDQLTNGGHDAVDELGPLELQIMTLQKQISESVEQCGRLQQFWLRQQQELVRQTQEAQQQRVSVDELKRKHTILEQKKLRMNAEIETHVREMGDVDKGIRLQQNDMIKLNVLMTKNRGKREDLQQGNSLTENEFIQKLKDAELECIQLQTRVSELKEGKTRDQNTLIEAERQILLWERKIQLAKEMRATVDSDAGQGEVKGMKAEIHRMEVRFNQLMRQQEKMIQDMEKSVYRRETITFRGEAQNKIGNKQTRAHFQKKIVDLQRKVKQVGQDATICDGDIKELRARQQNVSQQLEEKQANCQQMKQAVDALEGTVETLQESRQKKFSDLLLKQATLRYLQQAKDGRYARLCKSERAYAAERERQEEQLQGLASVVDRLNMEFPFAKSSLRRVTQELNWRMGSDL